MNSFHNNTRSATTSYPGERRLGSGQLMLSNEWTDCICNNDRDIAGVGAFVSYVLTADDFSDPYNRQGPAGNRQLCRSPG